VDPRRRLSVFALLGLGFTEDAMAFGEWLRARVDEHAGDASGPLKIMYRIDGSSELIEETPDHLDGYLGSRPVRNREWRVRPAAARHLRRGDELDPRPRQRCAGRVGRRTRGRQHIVAMIDWLCEHWHDPDEGIWETRGGRRPFFDGQLMSSVALDRAIRMATSRGRGWQAGGADARLTTADPGASGPGTKQQMTHQGAQEGARPRPGQIDPALSQRAKEPRVLPDREG
jgi:GH15 family glucan-1,4-alpha-glucosidase